MKFQKWGKRNPFIIGYEIVSPLGMDFETSWEQSLKGKSGIRKISRFSLPESFPVSEAGEVPSSGLQESSPFLAYGLEVVRKALSKNQLIFDPRLARRTAVTFTSSIGGLETMLGGGLPLLKNFNVHHVSNIISRHLGLLGPSFSPVGACASGNISLAIGAALIRENLADLVVCGASDFPLIETLMEAFSLKYMNEGDRAYLDPGFASRPFSRDPGHPGQI